MAYNPAPEHHHRSDIDRPGGCYHRLTIQLQNVDNLLLLLQSLRAVAGKDTTTKAAGDGSSTILHIRATNDDNEQTAAGIYMTTESLSKTVLAGCFFPAHACRGYDLKAFTFNHRLGRLQELPVQEFPAEFAIYASPLINALQVFRAPTMVRLLYDSTPLDAAAHTDDDTEDDGEDDDAVLKVVVKDQSLGNDAECQCVVINDAERLDADEVLETDDLPSAKCDVLATEVLAAIGQELTVSSYLGSKGEIAPGAASVEASVCIRQQPCGGDSDRPALEIRATDWAADAEVETSTSTWGSRLRCDCQSDSGLDINPSPTIRITLFTTLTVYEEASPYWRMDTRQITCIVGKMEYSAGIW
ncbi:hypothetical protein FOZ63_030182 [Perkinsus olseni]|uniref:Uncharacterized protein n=1 Tax=Perkinsus olseni TaxID=32597 RepID=A0A7J6QBJ3_PEROL|nr:hypothetical protein FOZ63_030182 [Perkinsus olseni]